MQVLLGFNHRCNRPTRLPQPLAHGDRFRAFSIDLQRSADNLHRLYPLNCCVLHRWRPFVRVFLGFFVRVGTCRDRFQLRYHGKRRVSHRPVILGFCPSYLWLDVDFQTLRNRIHFNIFGAAHRLDKSRFKKCFIVFIGTRFLMLETQKFLHHVSNSWVPVIFFRSWNEMGCHHWCLALGIEF